MLPRDLRVRRANKPRLIGGMGFTGWTPFGFLPEIGYTWSSGPFEISIRSGWLFVAPLVVGGIAFLVALWKHRSRKLEVNGENA